MPVGHKVRNQLGRRSFIGGSDARIIMGNDEAALIRLWREKRGEVGPEDLSGNLIVQLGTATEDLNRAWYERNTGHRVTDVQRRVKHSAIAWMAATLDGIVEGTGAVFEAKFMLPWSFSEEAAAEKQWPSSSTTCGSPTAVGGVVDHHRRREMGRDHGAHGPALPQHSGLGGEEVLALRPVRGNSAPDQRSAAAPAHRGHPNRRYELVQLLGGVRGSFPQHPRCVSWSMSGPRPSSKP